jgi:nickel-type superoxide dismutase maturation protease
MAAATPIPLAGLREALLWLAGRRLRVRVSGRSMLPTLPDGGTVLLEPGARPEPGAVVVAWHPFLRRQRVIKRVTAVDEAGRVRLVGDNPDESAHRFGALPPEAVLGVVRSRLGGDARPRGASAPRKGADPSSRA